MLKSMTGYGVGTSSDDSRCYSVEIRTVNHKFCDVKVKIPRDFSGLESKIQGLVRKGIARGRAEVFLDVSVLPNVEQPAVVDTALAQSYKNGLELLRDALDLSDSVTLPMVAGLPGVLKAPELEIDLDLISPTVETAVTKALLELERMRINEGNGLQRDIETHLALVEQGVRAVANGVATATGSRKEKLAKRLQEALQDIEIDEMRLAQEVAILVDRADVAEELSRMDIHLTQFRKVLLEDQPVGRKLDFLLQEMNREVNTTGAKCSDASIAHSVVDLKSNLERIREQVQNVE